MWVARGTMALSIIIPSHTQMESRAVCAQRMHCDAPAAPHCRCIALSRQLWSGGLAWDVLTDEAFFACSW